MSAYLFAQNLAHRQQQLALLTGQFASDRRTPNVRNMVRALANRTQDVENALFAVIASQLLGNGPTGQALKQIADLVQADPGSFTDPQLQLWVKVIIRARASGGLSEDAIQISALALGDGVASYTDYFPAGYKVIAFHILEAYAEPLAKALHLAKPPGVCGVLEWSSWPTGQNIVLDDSVSRAVGAQGLRDAVSGQFPFKLAGAIQL